MTKKERKAFHAKRYLERHPEKEAARKAAWHARNKKRLNEKARAYYADHRKELNAKNIARYRATMADPIKRLALRETTKKNLRKNRSENRQRYNAWSRNYFRKQRAENPEFLILSRLRNRMRDFVRRKKAAKHSPIKEVIGCSPSELRAHIESLFKPGMTWENRSLWAIDHIRPCASFNLLDPEQQKCCFHYTNLQPLWEIENKSKQDKIA